jgi:twinkle protein
MTASFVRSDARTVSEQLADRIDSLARQLLPTASYGAGRRTLRCGSVAGEDGQSLCVWLDGARRGNWRDYASGSGGDALDLAAAVLCRGDLATALRWARGWLGSIASILKRLTD